MKIKYKKITPNARIKGYATPGAAAFDIYPNGMFQELGMSPEFVDIAISTGLSFEIPEGYAMLVYSRSGHAFNFGINLINGVGVIDSDYRGELKIMLRIPRRHFEEVGFMAKLADKPVAQGIITPILQVDFEEATDLSETLRGAGGFGSTNHSN